MDNFSPSLRPEGGGAGAAVEEAPGEGEADAAMERWAPCGEAGCMHWGGKGGEEVGDIQIFKRRRGGERYGPSYGGRTRIVRLAGKGPALPTVSCAAKGACGKEGRPQRPQPPAPRVTRDGEAAAVEVAGGPGAAARPRCPPARAGAPFGRSSEGTERRRRAVSMLIITLPAITTVYSTQVRAEKNADIHYEKEVEKEAAR